MFFVVRYLYVGGCGDGRYWFVWGNGLYFTYVTYVGGRRVQKTELFCKLSSLTREVFEKLPRKVREVLQQFKLVKFVEKTINNEVKKLINYAITCTKMFHNILKTLIRGTPDLDIAWKIARRSGDLIEKIRQIIPNGDEWVRKYELDELIHYQTLPLTTQIDYLSPKDAPKLVKKLANAIYDTRIIILEQKLTKILQQI